MPLKSITRRFRHYRAKRSNARADTLWRSGQFSSAEILFRIAIKADPTYAPAYSNLGSMLMNVHRYDEGFHLIQKAAKLAPAHPGIQVNLGNAYALSGRLTAAIDCYESALSLDPCNREALLNIARPLMEICDWDGMDRHIARLMNMASHDPGANWHDYLTPFNSLFCDISRQDQLSIARRYAQRLFPHTPSRPLNPRHHWEQGRRRIRIGYLSSDYHNHPTSHLMLGIFAQHNRDRFETYAYSIGAPDSSKYRMKISGDCDHFVDVHDKDSEHIVKRIIDDGIDILIDLKGYTGGSRPDILACRPAPIQVNYLGYPGTMGASFMDYLVADAAIIPPEHERDYSEHVIRLPGTYQATDDTQALSSGAPSRAAVGLPSAGFVYCCFNTPAKIDRRSFGAWMRILHAVPASVLWLLETTPEVRRHLEAAADSLGVDPRRLIFAPILPKPDHLARLQLANLTLDTFHCNAHTTASDSLWVNVPVVTLTGQTFASRVATSLLSATDLGDLIADREDQFVRIAVELALNESLLDSLRSKLATQKRRELFNTGKFVRSLECAYDQMLSLHASPMLN